MTLFLTSFFRTSLNNRHLFGASCLSRCLIYKVHTAANLSRRVLMITHRFRFVKNFFQVFSNFFEALSFAAYRGYLAPASQPTRLGYHTQFALSRTFFQVFQTFFQALKPANPWAACVPDRFCPVAERLLILAKPLRFVNTFFYFFPPFFPLSFPQPYLRLYPPFPPQDVHFSTLFSTSSSVSTFSSSPFSAPQVRFRRTFFHRNPTCGKTALVIPCYQLDIIYR